MDDQNTTPEGTFNVEPQGPPTPPTTPEPTPAPVAPQEIATQPQPQAMSEPMPVATPEPTPDPMPATAPAVDPIMAAPLTTSSKQPNKKLILIGIGVIVFLLVGYLVYHFVFAGEPEEVTEETTTEEEGTPEIESPFTTTDSDLEELDAVVEDLKDTFDEGETDTAEENPPVLGGGETTTEEEEPKVERVIR